MLAEIVDITRFKNSEELAVYVGMIPMCHSSGEHDGTGDITVRKHAILRANVIEAAWVAIRKDEAMQLCYLNNCKKMVPSKAIVKVARKLVNRVYFVLKRRQPYENAVESLFTEDILRVLNLDLRKRSVGLHILLSKDG